jgi:hypothetical protein
MSADPAVLRLGRRSAARGHADGRPHRQQPGHHRTVRLGLGHTGDVSMIDGEIEVLEIDALPQQRGDRFAAHRLRPACAGHAVSLVPYLPAPHPGLAR